MAVYKSEYRASSIPSHLLVLHTRTGEAGGGTDVVMVYFVAALQCLFWTRFMVDTATCAGDHPVTNTTLQSLVFVMSDNFYFAGRKPFGNGPDTKRLETEGNAYIRKEFPRIDFLKNCEVEV